MQVVVADCSPLIAFSAIHRLDLLQKIFTEVWVPTAVHKEAVTDGEGWINALDLQIALKENKWLRVESISAGSPLPSLRHLGAGEAEALTLAMKTGLAVLMDDRAGRKAAVRHGVSLLGTLAVLALAKGRGLIVEAKPLLEAMVKAGIRFHPNLVKDFLASLGEA